MNIFYIFWGQNCSKIFSKTHQFAPLKKKSGEHNPEPPIKRVAKPLQHDVWRHPNTPTFLN